MHVLYDDAVRTCVPTTPSPCPTCRGSGVVAGSPRFPSLPRLPGWTVCPACWGAGGPPLRRDEARSVARWLRALDVPVVRERRRGVVVARSVSTPLDAASGEVVVGMT